jgi:uncharacterized protein YegP (UPF0339 family)
MLACASVRDCPPAGFSVFLARASGKDSRGLPNEGERGARKFKKGLTDRFHLDLLAANGQVIATSEAYNSKEAALTGIESVKTTPRMRRPRTKPSVGRQAFPHGQRCGKEESQCKRCRRPRASSSESQ